MIEVIKFAFKIILHYIGLIFSRTSEKRLTKIDKNKENYQTITSDYGYAVAGAESYFAIRVPFVTKNRFSVLFPGVLNSLEQNYFNRLSWVVYFMDDRIVPESEAKKGYFLRWTSEAIGTEGIFPALWKAAMELPVEAQEIHSDGEFLRVIFKGSTASVSNLNRQNIRASLEKLIQKIKTLEVRKVSRLKFTDRMPVTSWFAKVGILLIFFSTYFYITPNISYLDSKTGSKVCWFAGFIILGYFIFRSREEGVMSAFKSGVYKTVFSVFMLIALYTRFNYSVMTNSLEENWTINHVSVKTKASSPKSYEIRLKGPDGKSDSLTVSAYKLNGLKIPEAGMVKMRVRKDIFGFEFADSAVIEISGQQVDLLNLSYTNKVKK